MDQKKQPHPIDVHVGSRVRMRRVLLGMSQEKLGGRLGLTFQQVQKYEKGANRIGASRLWELSNILEVPVGFFYENAAGSPEHAEGLEENGQQDFVTDFVQSGKGLNIIKYFVRIKNPEVRRNVLNMVRAIAKADETS